MKMRFIFILVLALNGLTFFVSAAPRAKRKSVPTSVAVIRPVPLSPTQLSGKVVYTLGKDVWALTPQTRHKQLLYKGLGTISWSPDREQVAFVSGECKILVMKWDGSGKRLIPRGDEVSELRWSPDGSKLLYTQSDSLLASSIQRVGFCVVDLKGGQPDYNSDRQTGRYLNQRWSRDGQHILSSYMAYDSGDFDAYDSGNFDHLPAHVLSLDSKRVEDFKYNWQDFMVDNQSHDGKRRAEHIVDIPPNIGQWQIEEASNARNVVWQEGDGFSISSVHFGNNSNQFVVEGGLIQWSVNSHGMVHCGGLYGIWLVTLRNQMQPSLQLLAENAHLIDWF